MKTIKTVKGFSKYPNGEYILTDPIGYETGGRFGGKGFIAQVHSNVFMLFSVDFKDKYMKGVNRKDGEYIHANNAGALLNMPSTIFYLFKNNKELFDWLMK